VAAEAVALDDRPQAPSTARLERKEQSASDITFAKQMATRASWISSLSGVGSGHPASATTLTAAVAAQEEEEEEEFVA